MGHDGGENLLRFDNFREEVGPSNGKLRSPAGGKTAISRFESILPDTSRGTVGARQCRRGGDPSAP